MIIISQECSVGFKRAVEQAKKKKERKEKKLKEILDVVYRAGCMTRKK